MVVPAGREAALVQNPAPAAQDRHISLCPPSPAQEEKKRRKRCCHYVTCGDFPDRTSLETESGWDGLAKVGWEVEPAKIEWVRDSVEKHNSNDWL